MNATSPVDRPWYSGVTRYQWLVLVIACLGWIFDAFEGQVFVVSMHEAMPALLPAGTSQGNVDFYNNLAFAAFLVGGAVGGLGFGMLSDRVGRVRTMMLTILCYSAFTSLSAFSQVWWQMVALRFFVALGVGGEWAVASAMVAEVFPEHARSMSQGIFHGSSVLGHLDGGCGWHFDRDRLGMAVGLRGRPAAGLAHDLDLRLACTSRSNGCRPAPLAAVDRSRGRPAGCSTSSRADLVRSTLVGLALATVGLATFWGVYMRGDGPHARNWRKTPGSARGLRPRQTTSWPSTPALPDDEQELHQAASKCWRCWRSRVGGGVGMLCFCPDRQPFRPPRRRSWSIAWAAPPCRCWCSKSCPTGAARMLWWSVAGVRFLHHGHARRICGLLSRAVPHAAARHRRRVLFQRRPFVGRPDPGSQRRHAGHEASRWPIAAQPSGLLFLLGVVVLFLLRKPKAASCRRKGHA